MAATSSYRDCFAEKFNDCSGYVRSVENAFLLLREFETATTSRFVVEQATFSLETPVCLSSKMWAIISESPNFYMHMYTSRKSKAGYISFY